MPFLLQLLLFMLGSSAADLGTTAAKRSLGLNTEEELQKLALGKELEEKKTSREATTLLRKSELEKERRNALAQLAIGQEQAEAGSRRELLSNPEVMKTMSQSMDLQDILGVRF